LGNDGKYLASPYYDNAIKALVKNRHTRRGIIVVANLHGDGLTLHKTSNQPGDDIDLQLQTLCAPGTEIISTLLYGKTKARIYGKMTGTSFAAPHVAGVAAVVLSNYPTLIQEQLAQALLLGATPIMLDLNGIPYEVPGIDAGCVGSSGLFSPDQITASRRKYGMGRVNMRGALDRAANILGVPSVVRIMDLAS
jgi:subtilisin family serine protease